MNAAKSVKITVALAVALVVLVGMASAQEKPLTISDILTTAKCPLTEDQTTKLKNFSFGDPESFMGLNQLFTDDQTKALKEAFGTQQGMGDMPESPRFLFFAVIFENEGCPFTDAQVAKIKALPDGDGMAMFEQMQDIFTEKQSGVLQGMFGQ